MLLFLVRNVMLKILYKYYMEYKERKSIGLGSKFRDENVWARYSPLSRRVQTTRKARPRCMAACEQSVRVSGRRDWSRNLAPLVHPEPRAALAQFHSCDFTFCDSYIYYYGSIQFFIYL